MTDINALLEENRRLKLRIKELEGKYSLEEGETYYMPDFDECGIDARFTCAEWDRDVLDYYRFDNGLVFKTREEANALANDMLCYTRLRKAYKTYWSTVDPDNSESLYTLSKPLAVPKASFCVVDCEEATDIFRFTSKEDAESFLKDNNEDLLKFYSVWND